MSNSITLTQIKNVAFKAIENTNTILNLYDLLSNVKKIGILKTENINEYISAINTLNKVLDNDISEKEFQLIKEILKRLEFAKNLLKYRLKSEYSTRELANFSNLHHTYIGKLESCKMSPPSTEKIKSLSLALGIEPQELIPDFKDTEKQTIDKIYTSPTIRKIIKELDGLDEVILDYFLNHIKEIKRLKSN